MLSGDAGDGIIQIKISQVGFSVWASVSYLGLVRETGCVYKYEGLFFIADIHWSS